MLLFPKFSLVRGLALGASRHFPQLKYAPAFVLNMCVHTDTPPKEICLPSVSTGVFLNFFGPSYIK